MAIQMIRYPKEIDPLRMVEEKIIVCPFCKTNKHVLDILKGGERDFDYIWADEEGKTHGILTHKNKYRWIRARCTCGECKAKWISDWAPYDLGLLGGDALKSLNIIELNAPQNLHDS